jgi:hypothetical protein
VASTSCTKERQRKDKRLTRHALAFVLQRLHFLASSAWGKYASDSQFAASRLTLPETPGYSSCFSRSLLPSCLPSFLPPMPASIKTITRLRSILYYFLCIWNTLLIYYHLSTFRTSGSRRIQPTGGQKKQLQEVIIQKETERKSIRKNSEFWIDYLHRQHLQSHLLGCTQDLVPDVKCDPYRTFSPGLLLSTLAKKEEKIQKKKESNTSRKFGTYENSAKYSNVWHSHREPGMKTKEQIQSSSGHLLLLQRSAIAERVAHTEAVDRGRDEPGGPPRPAISSPDFRRVPVRRDLILLYLACYV